MTRDGRGAYITGETLPKSVGSDVSLNRVSKRTQYGVGQARGMNASVEQSVPGDALVSNIGLMQCQFLSSLSIRMCDIKKKHARRQSAHW